jgi:sugar lactone lactonase YvrE
MSLLLSVACASCADYSAPSRAPDPPDPTFEDGLWTLSGILPGIFRLTSSQLQASDTVTPATSITSSSAALDGFNSIAFDAAGTLWMTSQTDSTLLAFSRSTLATSGERVASTVIASAHGSLDAPSALAFDATGGLWVANTNNGTLVRYDSAQLATGGTPTPKVILSGVGHPTGLAFDAAGGLWFSDGAAHRISKYGAAQLETSGFKLPEVVLTSNGPDISNPVGLAFDAAGNLWIANSGLLNVVALQANHLATTAFVHADIVISPGSFSSLPLGLAFDEHQNLWVVYAEGVVTEYDHAALAASGTPAPAVRLMIKDHVLFRSLAFWPKPAGLPLR